MIIVINGGTPEDLPPQGFLKLGRLRLGKGDILNWN